MEYRVLGKTGLEISRLGFGGIPIQKIDAEGTRVLIGELLKAGVNYIDTVRCSSTQPFFTTTPASVYASKGAPQKFRRKSHLLQSSVSPSNSSEKTS